MNGNLSPQELEAVLKLKKSGGNADQAKELVISMRRATPAKPITPTTTGDSMGVVETVSDIGETVANIGKRWSEAAKFSSQAGKSVQDADSIPLLRELRAGGQIAGEIGGAVSDTVGELFLGTGKLFLDQEQEDTVKRAFQTAIAPITQSPQVQEMVQNYEWLKENDPARARDVRAALGGINFLADFAGMGTVSSVRKGAVKEVVDETLPKSRFSQILEETTKTDVDNIGEIPAGMVAKAEEFVTETLPNVTKNVQDYFQEAQLRNARIRQSSPVIAEAIKNNVPDPIINRFISSDEANKEVMRKIVSGYKSGDQRAITNTIASVADEQYKVIDTKLETIGTKMNEAIQALPKSKVDMSPAISELRSRLETAGFIFKDGKINEFGRTGMSSQEEKWVQEMFNKLSLYEGEVTWQELKQADSLLSRINREAYKAGTRPPHIGEKNLATEMRDVIRERLEDEMPQLRELNNEWRKYSQFQEALDETIFNIGKTYGIDIDPGATAQNRLRRIFSNAQSAETYRAIVEQLDDFARAEGYKGANLIDITDFNLQVQSLYPETIKSASFEGGIQTGIGGALNTISKLGSPQIKSTQKALEDMVGIEDIVKTPTEEVISP